VTRTQEVFVVVRRGGRFLVLHRSEANGAYWHGVAGGVEAGESFAAAAARELNEETGLEAEPSALPDVYDYDGIRVECFAVEAPSGWEPELDWEHDDYRWCTVDEAVELLYWPEPRALLRSLG
jgi:8-oxo-dGTP pyrophosphatase MutT (NUDIX family)